MLESEGASVGFVQIKMLHPFPAKYVEHLLDNTRVIIDVESNQTAQLGQIFSQHISRNIDNYILKYTGRAMTCDEICDALRDIIRGKAPYRTVLTHGA